jgi:hypothetical protein
VQALLSNSMMLMVSLGDFSHDHIIETRLELEGLCCRLAAKHCTKQQLEQMWQEARLQENPDLSHVEFCASDVRFHMTLARASHNPLLAFLTSALLESLQPVTNLIVFRFRDRKQSVLHLRRILKALEAGDAQAAETALVLQMTYIRKKYKEARAWKLSRAAAGIAGNDARLLETPNGGPPGDRGGAGGAGPRRRRAAKQRDELPPFHSITSSAVASSAGGTVRPSALAVLRLMTNSNLVGCTTGRSAAFSPLI